MMILFSNVILCTLLTSWAQFLPQLLLPNLDNTKSQSVGGEKSSRAQPKDKTAEDVFIDSDKDSDSLNRFERDIHYDNLFPAPPASELDEGGADNSIDIVIVTTTTSTPSSTSTLTSTITTTTNTPNPVIDDFLKVKPNANLEPLRDLSPVVAINAQNPASTANKANYDKSVTKYTFVTPGSSYVNLPHGKRPCQHNADCYNMREPDEWCPTVAHSDQYFERGCFCEHAQAYCVVERRNGPNYEHTDCYPKSESKCEV